ADVLIDDHPPGWLESLGLDPQALMERHPSLVICHITPFGREAPAEWLPAEAPNVFHRSGWGYHTPGSAPPARPPLKAAGGHLVEHEAGLDAALCILACLVGRERSGRGELIDVSERDVLVSRADTVLGRVLAGEDSPSDARTAFELGGPASSFACRDGHLFLF